MTSLSGKNGLKELARSKFDLVITDYNMPLMNGAEFAGLAKQKYPKIPVILYSGSSLDSMESVDLFLLKPFSIEELRDGISKLL